MDAFKKLSLVIVGASLAGMVSTHLVYGVDTYNNKKTTTVEQTTTQTTSTAPRPSAAPAKKAAPVVTTTSNTTTSTTKEGDLRRVLDEEALRKMSATLCVKGFKAYVGVDTRNVCQNKATAPDIAYSCIWKQEGNAAYAPMNQGLCTLDYAEHQGSIIVTKNDYKSSPPLPYGVEAQCCFRAAQGPSTNSVEISPTTTTVTPVSK